MSATTSGEIVDLMHQANNMPPLASYGSVDWLPAMEQAEEDGVDTEVGGEGKLSNNEIKLAQRRDPYLKFIFYYLEDNVLPEDDKLARRVVMEAGQMEIVEGLLIRHWWPQRANQRTATRAQIVVPQELVEEVLQAMHDDLLTGHLGEKRTLQRIQLHYWWPDIYKNTTKYVKTCPTCQQRNSPKGRTPGLLQPIEPATRPFERVGVDFVGPLPQTKSENKHILVFVDYLTKWPEAFAVPEATAEVMAQTLMKEIVARHGAPEQLLSDRGKSFLSDVLKEVNEFLGVRKINTTAYHPQTDGLVERFNGTLENLLAKFVSDRQDDWDVLLPYVLLAYRSSRHDATNDLPFFLLYGREPNLPVDVSAGIISDPIGSNPHQYRHELVTRLQEAWRIVRENQRAMQEKNQRAYNKHRNEAD